MKEPKLIATVVLSCLLLLVTAGPARADTVTLTFGGPDFQWFNNGLGGFDSVWTTGGFWAQDFMSTGIAASGSMTLDLNISNVLSSGFSEAFDTLLNGVDVGNFTIDSGQSGVLIFKFKFPSVSGPNFDIEMEMTSATIPPGDGSVALLLNGPPSRALISGRPVPESSTWWLLGLGIVALSVAYVRQRTSRVKA
jgi:hypothetical protein